MNLRWLFGNFTDPQYELPRREQFRLSNLAHRKFVDSHAFFIRTAIIIVPFLVALAALEPLLHRLGYRASSPAYAIGIAVLIFIFWVWCAWMYRALYIVPIRKVMREKGYDLCLNCGYDLRGQPDDAQRCPECGAERTDELEPVAEHSP